MRRTLLTCAICALYAAGPAVAESGGSQQRSGQVSNSSTQIHSQVRSQSQMPGQTQAMSQLTDAAQRLREAIQAIAQLPAGDARADAIRTAHRALFDTQQAMIDLPPELRRVDDTSGAQHYNSALTRLKRAAQSLRDSTHAIARQPAGDRRNEAIEQTTEALLGVNQAMMQLPWVPESQGHRAYKEHKGADMSAFDRLDADGDGMLGREEFLQRSAEPRKDDPSYRASR